VRGSKLSADGNRWQVSSVSFFLLLMVVLVIEGRDTRNSLQNEVSAIRD